MDCAGLGQRATPERQWDRRVMEELAVLQRREAPALRARGERLQDGLAVLLGVGELADQA